MSYVRTSLACALLCACLEGGETGNPVARGPGPLQVQLALAVRSSAPDVVAISESTSGTRIDEAWVAFGAAEFLDDDACAGSGELDGDGKTELVANIAVPSPYIRINTAPGSYCGLLLPLTLGSQALPAGAPDELHDHSVVLRGERADGTPFVLSHPEQAELELTSSAADIDAKQGPFILVFDAARWMDDVALEDATLRDDGTIRIDADENRALLELFESNLECSLQLHRDEDSDGAPDAEDDLIGSCAPE